MQTSKRKIYDAIVVGSGATGGWAAKALTERGMTVLVLEAGRQLDPQKDFREHTFPYELKYRGVAPGSQYAPRQPVQCRCYAENEYGHHLFVDDIDNPYTTPDDKPFWWIRGRQVGGRSITWGRQTYRLSDYDFKAAERDGYGDPWPFSYEDLKPYYEQVENFVGISGSYENLPQLPDSNFLPPMAMTCGERILKKSVESKYPGRNVIIGRVAILTKSHQGRAACHYCGHCDRGCSTHSYYSSPGSTLPAAAKTGKMTLRPNAVVREIIVDPNTGKASGVRVVNQITKRDDEEYGRVIVLCASTLESTRILLNSKSRQYPNGLGNSSGVVGHYLVDHFGGVGASGYFHSLAGRDPVNEDGKASGLLVPRFRNIDKDSRQQKFIRGYGFECGSAMGRYPGVAKDPRFTAGFGSEFKKLVRKWSTTSVWMTTRAEMLSRFENYVEIDPDGVVDAWGIPVLKIHAQHSDNEREMARDARDCAEEILRAAGAEEVSTGGRISV